MNEPKKSIRLRIVDWWDSDTEENFNNNFFVKLLRKKYDVTYSDTPDFIFFSVFGQEHLKYDCVRFFLLEKA